MIKALAAAAVLVSLPAAAAFTIEKPKDHASGIAELKKEWTVDKKPQDVDGEKWGNWTRIWSHVSHDAGGDILYILRDGAAAEGAMTVSVGGSTGDALMLQTLVTAPKNLGPHGKRGAGSALAGAAIRLAMAEKLTAIELSPDNDAAEKFWAGIGFKPTGKGMWDPWRLDAKEFATALQKKGLEPLSAQADAQLAKEAPVKTKKPKSKPSAGCCIM